MTEGFIQNVQFDLFSVELVIEDTATLSLAEDFIQNIQFDLFSVKLVIGETATLLMAENYVTIREVFVNGVKVEPNEEKQIFLYSGVTSHNQLTGKNAETTFQHIDTTITKETLVETDKVAIYDSVTGKVVLTSKDNVGGSGGAEIDDATTSTEKVWSSQKTSTVIDTKQDTLVSGSSIKTIDGVSILGGGNIVTRALTLVTTNNNDFVVNFSGDLHYNTVPAGQTNNLGFACVNCPTTNKEFVYIVRNNRVGLLMVALPPISIVQGGITYKFEITTSTTTIGISPGTTCEFNFLFIKIDDTNFEVRIAVQKFVLRS